MLQEATLESWQASQAVSTPSCSWLAPLIHPHVCKNNVMRGLVENFNERFTMFIEALPTDWDMFYLGAYQLNVEPCNNLMVRAIDTSSMHAYCIKPEKLEEMIQVAKDYDGHIDVAYRFHHPKIRAYAAKPTLVRQSPSYSDIECKDVDYMSWYV